MERLPARSGTPAPWPGWVPVPLRAALAGRKVTAPWRHQAQAASLARDGRHVVVATGTGSGKSLRSVTAGQWPSATRDVIAQCPCETGCPSCVQSPKCGNGNQPLAKADAVRALGVVLSALDPDRDRR